MSEDEGVRWKCAPRVGSETDAVTFGFYEVLVCRPASHAVVRGAGGRNTRRSNDKPPSLAMSHDVAM